MVKVSVRGLSFVAKWNSVIWMNFSILPVNRLFQNWTMGNRAVRTFVPKSLWSYVSWPLAGSVISLHLFDNYNLKLSTSFPSHGQG